MKSANLVKAWVVFLVALSLAAPAWAQLTRAGITGTVTDPSGAVIPGVSVIAVNEDTGVESATVTNNVGIYRIVGLPIGHYGLSFKKTGFVTVQRTGITLTIDQVAGIDITMNVGQVTQTVQVKAGAPILQTQTTDVGGAMTNTAIQALPMDVSGGRDIQMFAYDTVPGLQGESWDSFSNGQMADSNEVLIDGTVSQEYANGLISESNPPFVAVQEFKVDTGGMGGEAGMYTGGTTFEYQLKSGTNQFHGTAQYYLQNEALDANSWGNDVLGIPKSFDRRDDEAIGVGGPIYIPHVYHGRNRTFFYFAFEREREANFTPGSLTYTVPTTAFMNGDFSDLLGAPLCSNTSGTEGPCSSSAGLTAPMYVQNTNGQSVPLVEGMIFDPESPNASEVFPNNQIPGSRFSKYASNLLALYQKYYAPMASGDRNNYQGIGVNDPSFEEKNWSLKLDHNFSPMDRISGSFYWTNRPRLLDDSNAGPWSSVEANQGGPFSGDRNQLVTTRAWRANETHIFSPNIVNTAAFTYERFFFGDHVIPSEIDQWPSGLFASSDHPAIIVNFAGNINGVGESEISTGNSGSLTGFEDYVADDTLSWLNGHHTITFGGELRAFQLDSGGVPGAMNYNFSNSQTGMPLNSQLSIYEGFAFASFLMGDVGSASMTIPGEQYGRRKSYSLYVQDSYRVNSRLTTNYGLTWNVEFPRHEKYGRWANFNTSYVNPATGERGEIQYLSQSIMNPTDGGGSFEPMVWDKLAPHAGFAYMITHRLVARASYGIYDIPVGMSTYCGVPYCYGPDYFPYNVVNPNANFTPAFDWDSGYPGKTVYSPALYSDVTASGNGAVASINPKILTAQYLEELNAGVEFELTPNTRLSANYLGNWGHHLQDGSLEENAAPIADYANLAATGNNYNWVSDAASASAAGVPYPYQGFAGYAYEALAPFANVASAFGGSGATLYYVGSPYGWSDYDALQVDLNHRTSHGLTMDFNYDFERDLSSYPTDFTTGAGGTWLGSAFEDTYAGYSYFYQNLYNLSAAGNFEQPYNQSYWKGYVVYDLPFGKGRRFLSNGGRWLNGALGGWTTSWLVGYNTGDPVPVTSNNYYPGELSEVYSDVAPGADLSRHFNTSRFDASTAGVTPNPNNMYFSPNGFSNPLYGKLGNSGPYLAGLHNFGSANEDAALYKTFKIKERVGLQFRIDYFDVFNRSSYSTPDTNIDDPLFGEVTSWPTGNRYGQLSVQVNW